jgi:hypothetical protein
MERNKQLGCRCGCLIYLVGGGFDVMNRTCVNRPIAMLLWEGGLRKKHYGRHWVDNSREASQPAIIVCTDVTRAELLLTRKPAAIVHRKRKSSPSWQDKLKSARAHFYPHPLHAALTNLHVAHPRELGEAG